VTDDSAFKRQVRARMAETGEKYTVARRMVIAEQDPAQPPVILRVYLEPHVDVELTAEAGRAYAAADELGRQEMASRLLADHIDAAGFQEAHVAAGSKIATDQELRAEAEETAIRGAVQRCAARAAGVRAVNVDVAADPVRVSVRAARPIVLAGRRGEEADRLRGELVGLTGRRVRLDILEAPDPQEVPRE
jgi:hypothetical protein